MESRSIKKRFLVVLLAFMVAFYIPICNISASDGEGNVDNGGGLADTMDSAD